MVLFFSFLLPISSLSDDPSFRLWICWVLACGIL
jgi:hypothetical protein